MKQKKLQIAGAVLAAVSMAWGVPVLAQQWPAKTVRIIVPFGAGGGTDIQARLLSKKFYESMKQTFVVDNRAGASGLIGGDLAAKSPPDGYTILFTTASLSVNATLNAKRITFDPLKDIIPISWVSSVPLVLVVHPSVPAKNPKDLVALAKKGRLNAAHNGAGTTSHLSVEMLNQFAGTKVTPVPYKGGGPAITALLSGETDFSFATALAAAPHVASGKVRALAVTTAKPAKAFPNLPTMSSLYPGFEADNWYAMFFPTGTPKEIVNKMNGEIKKAMGAKDIIDFLGKEGGEPVASSPEELTAYFKREIEKYAKVLKQGNIVGD